MPSARLLFVVDEDTFGGKRHTYVPTVGNGNRLSITFARPSAVSYEQFERRQLLHRNLSQH